MQNNTGSDSVTEGIRVQVLPEYIPEQSNPELNRFVFSYRVVITNEGDRWAKLLSRHWIIINEEGDREEVEGPGVVGYTPELYPGESFEYSSSTPLDTKWGTMEGFYKMMREDGEKFDAKIERFYLVSSQVLA
jgi:ApaG protein